MPDDAFREGYRDEAGAESEENGAREDPGELVTIATFSFPYQAEAAKLHLGEAGIGAFLADFETVTMDWLLGNAIGNIKVQVPRADVEAARAVLADRTPPAAADTDDDDSGVTQCLSCGREIPEQDSACPACGWSYTEENRFQE